MVARRSHLKCSLRVPAPTRLAALDAQPLDLPLLSPFGIAGGAQSVAHNVLVSVTLADGTRGWGEAAPLPAYNGETQAQALAVLEAARPRVVDRDASDWRSLASEFRAAGGATCGSAQAAFEMAMLDALTRQRGEALWRFFGGAGTELETDMTITTGSVADAEAAARDIGRRGIRIIKVKIGGPAGPAHDLARIAMIREIAPEAPLILDGNASMSRPAASELARGLKARAIEPTLLEQWLPKEDLPGMAALHAETGWTVAADESVVTPMDALRVAHAGAAQVINIKLMKAGVAAALDIVAIAKETGLGLMIGGNVESILGMTASACFAAGIGGFSHADLDTPLFLASNPFVGGFTLDGGRVSVARIASGHGVTPRPRERPAPTQARLSSIK